MNREIKVNQTLHGYENGHRLLTSSKKFPKNIERKLLILSDLSGSSSTKGFETYISGYPLNEIYSYAISKTWYAPEMDRPGCVWTHTLIIENLHLEWITREIIREFKKPKGLQNLSSYRKLISIYPSDNLHDNLDLNVYKDLLCEILNNLYSNSSKPIYLVSNNSDDFETLILNVWNQQWPYLKETFSLCSGSIASRKNNGKQFDLQIIPKKNYGKIKRNSDDGIFIDPINLSINKEYPSWVKTAVTDLIYRENNHSLKNFLKDVGNEKNNGRAEFSKYSIAYKILDEFNTSQITFYNLVDEVGELFPLPSEGKLLKSCLFISNFEGSKYISKNIGHKDILSALCKTDYYHAYDQKTLGIEEKATALWKTSRKNAVELAQDLISTNINPIGESFLIGISKVISDADLESVLNANRNLFQIFLQYNPLLASSTYIWKSELISTRDIFNLLISSPNLNPTSSIKIINAILDSGVTNIASEVIQHFKIDAIEILLNWILFSEQSISKGMWMDSLRSYPSLILDWVSKSDNVENDIMIEAFNLVNPNTADLSSINFDIWNRLSNSSFEGVGRRKLIKIMSLLLAISLSKKSMRYADIVKKSFMIVYSAAMDDSLEYESWRYLSRYLPDLGLWRSWDKCESLRRGLIHSYVTYNWPKQDLLETIDDHEAFKKLVIFARGKRDYKTYLRKLYEDINTGELSASHIQQQVLSDYL